MKTALFNQLVQADMMRDLFTEHLGWNKPSNKFPIYVAGFEGAFKPLAERNSFHVLMADAAELPSPSALKRIDSQLRPKAEDYIAIFRLKGESKHQLWMVPVKKVEKRDLVSVEFDAPYQTEYLAQKLSLIEFGIEERTTIVDVKARVHKAFLVNSEQITKDFYKGFKVQHKAFAAQITGINDSVRDADNRDKQWYASVMLNRLMFCYFIQKKGFLDGDLDYLTHKLEMCREEEGENKFYRKFYKAFLRRLFSDGLNSTERTEDFKRDFGRIPYLNGGMFDSHELEKKYGDIDIPDEAFDSLFGFFGKWRWHLDTRITQEGKDINPDVLGYIFEQYINDRAQMGAYYTKEDITEYIGRNTILPFLLEKTKKSTKETEKSFDPEWGWVWRMLRESGDKYVFDAVKKGYSDDWRSAIPDEISVGLIREEEREEAMLPVTESHLNLLERRRLWNAPTPAQWALPTEIWRETIERLERCEDILSKIKNGEIHSINDFITYNLDIRQFATDLITEANRRGYIMWVYRFYDALRSVAILDPTCGSGPSCSLR
ncbi:MAG: hypothetical protein LIP03_03580 [Bacteroidales bacterium]|nr:hypothetical protein [Bacteroidales bacterium]